MTGFNLPHGCTINDIEDAQGDDMNTSELEDIIQTVLERINRVKDKWAFKALHEKYDDYWDNLHFQATLLENFIQALRDDYEREAK